MIGFWRTRSKTIIVHLVFWPIIAVFVIFGFERAGNPVGGAAAVVNDKTITIAEYRNALQRITDFYSQMMQGRFDEQAQKQYHIRETALNQLISNELISEQADKMGLGVTDEEVREKLLESPMLVKDGRFSRENYEGLLRYYHMTPIQFESDLKKSTVIEKTRRIFEGGMGPSLAQVEKDQKLKASKVNLNFLKVDRNDLLSKITITDPEASDFLKDDSHQKQAKEYFDLHKSEFSKEEEVSAHHILIKATKGNKAEEAAAQAKIKTVQSELAKTPFEEVAKKYSDDPGSKIKGGDLGSFSRGRMVPEFEKAAFSSQIGKVSEPIQSDFGYHLIRVDSKKPASTTPLDQAKLTIAKKLLAQKKMDDAVSLAEKKLSTDPEAAAKDLESVSSSVKWDETGFFSFGDEQIPKIGGTDEIAETAFKLTSSKPYATKLVHTGNTLYLLKLKEVKTEEIPDVKKGSIGKTDLTPQESAKNVFYAWTSSLVEKAKIKRNPRLFTDEGPTSEE